MQRIRPSRIAAALAASVVAVALTVGAAAAEPVEPSPSGISEPSPSVEAMPTAPTSEPRKWEL